MKFSFRTALAVLVLGWLFLNCPARAQNADETDFRMGAVYTEPDKSLNTALDAAATLDGTSKYETVTGTLDPVLRSYFKDLYNDKLADWVVYIDQKGNVHQYVRQKDEKTNQDKVGVKLFNQGNIWAVVFADFPTFPDPSGNTSNHSVTVNIGLESLKAYTSVSQSIFNSLAAAKTSFSASVSSSGNQSVTLTLLPAYDLNTVAADMSALQDLKTLKGMEDTQADIDKLLAQSGPSEQLLEEFQKELINLSAEVNKASVGKPEDRKKFLKDAAEAQGSITKFLAGIQTPQKGMKDLDIYLRQISAELKGLKSINEKMKGTLSQPVSQWGKDYEAKQKELAAKHLYLFTGIVRFSLDPNTLDRLTLRIPPESAAYFTDKPGEVQARGEPWIVSNTFGNTENSNWAISLGLGSFHCDRTAFQKDIQPDFYLLGHLYLAAPERPWNFQSASLFVGTQATLGTPFSQIPFGFDWGDPFRLDALRDVGLMVGGDLWRNGNNTFDIRWFYGFNYFL